MEAKMEVDVEVMQTDQNETKPVVTLPAKQNKRKKKNKSPKYDPTKNPIQVINEAYPQMEYLIDTKGEGINTVFYAKATIEGEEYSGEGTSKQRAKLQLATKAVENLKLNQPDGSEGESNIKRLKTGIEKDSFKPVPSGQSIAPSIPSQFDFTRNWDLYYQYARDFSAFLASMPGRDRDRPLYIPPSSPRHSNGSTSPLGTSKLQSKTNGEKKIFPSTHVIGPMNPTEAAQQGFSQLFTNRPTINLEKARSFPVMTLSEMFPEMKVNWIEGSGRGDRQFKVEAEVQGRRFFGEGRSKKIAKLNLAKTILLCMYDIHDFKEPDISSKPPKQKSDENGNLEKKYPLTQLKELVGDVTYEVIQEGGDDENEEKSYHATVVVNGIAYEAIGKSRNLAKLRVAKKALEVIKPRGIHPQYDENGLKRDLDTSRHPTMVFYELYRDVIFNESESRSPTGQTEYCLEAVIEDKTYKTKASSKKKAKLRLVLTAFEELREIAPSEWTCIDLKDVLEDKQLSSNPAANHPIVLLLKLNPQTRFEVEEDYDCNPMGKYKAKAMVGERDYDGEGPNKKSAKTAAARVALQNLYGIDPDTYVEDNRNDYFTDEEPKNELPVDLCNTISKVVQDQYNLVFQGETQCKVIAAFVVENHKNKNEEPKYEAVSIGTGTKCITGNQISHKGDTLNDCHGEVIACRGFRQYLYDNLLDAIDGNEDTIFVRKPPGRFALHPDVKIYLYVNTAPCGDGRVFTLQTQQQGAKNKTAGLLRTKIENGQGTIPVPENSVQTSDGILEGERLRTMSCSDKILKWNVLGVQGALLSYFIDPIYIEGIVIGLHYHYDALYRALYKRACRTENCPEPYRVNQPALGTPSSDDTSRDTSKATSNSFNWYKGQKTVEAVNATTGQTVILTGSRLCKLEFFNKFMEVLRKAKKNLNPKTYHEAKLSSKNYQKSKECFFKSLDETTCGKWIGKPYEHDMFGY